ncbi:MAG: hypothetical protein K2N52_03300, partial [Clostridia bacterium]|nr:hypothetical protein [Clostridia bacterium]
AYKYYLTSNSGTKTPISGTSLDVSNLAAGNYTVEVTLVANGETGYSADNKNYTIDSNSKNTQAFKIDAGGADTSGLVWSYQKDDNPSANLFGGEDGAQTVIKYALKSDGSASVYKIPAPEIPTDYNYLSIDTTKFTGGLKTVKVENGVETEVTGGCSLAGEYKTYVALKTTSNFLFDEGDATSTDRLEGVAVISWTISKAEVDLSGLKLEYGWVNDDTGEIDWVEYSADNPPTFKDAFVSIRVKSGVDGASYPAGIVNVDDIATNNYLTDRDIPGTVSATAKFTLDSNFVYVDSNEVTHEGTFNYVVSIELAKKKIPVSWTLDTIKDANGEEVLDDNGLPYQIYVIDFGADTDGLSQYVKYEYYYADVTDPANPVVGGAVPVQMSGTTTNGQLDYLIDVDGAGKVSGTSTKTVSIFVRAVIDTSVSGSEYYELNLPAGTYAEEYTKLGQKKTLVSVDIHKEEIEYGTEISNLSELYEIKKNNSIYSANSYTALIYAPNSSEGVNISDFDFATADVGEYIIKFALKASVSESDALNKTSFTLTIVAKEIEIPEISVKIEFNGETLNFADYLDGKYKEYLDAGIISAVSGRATAREANTSYVAVIEIINPNYKWKLPSGDEASATRALMRASLTADALSNSVSVDGVQKVATYNWFIAPYKLTTDIINTSGKDGAVINVNKLPEWVRELITDGSLTMGVAYYADEAATSPLTDDEIVLKGGRSYFVGAVVDGEERGNFTFATDDSVVSQSKAITYKVPQSGASALMNNVKEFMTKTFLGLPKSLKYNNKRSQDT